jgi:hypothetical protein
MKNDASLFYEEEKEEASKAGDPPDGHTEANENESLDRNEDWGYCS